MRGRRVAEYVSALVVLAVLMAAGHSGGQGVSGSGAGHHNLQPSTGPQLYRGGAVPNGTYQRIPDVTYAVGTCLDDLGQPFQIELKLDVYLPVKGPSTHRPAVLLIHGAVWGVPGITKQFPPLVKAAQHFAAEGLVCFSIDYRTGDLKPDSDGTNDWVKAQRASYVDAKAAVRWIRAHAAGYGVDPDQIAAIGGSSGAMSVIMLGVTEPDRYATDYPGGQIPPENHPFEDPSVQACLEFWGTCFEKHWGNPPLMYLFGFDDAFDPADTAPFLIVHGTMDKVFPYSDALAIEVLCNANGIQNKLVTLDGVGHGVWDSTVGSPPQSLYEVAADFLALDLGWKF